jgi:hypothetical protein
MQPTQRSVFEVTCKHETKMCEIDERTLPRCCRVSDDQTDATENGVSGAGPFLENIFSYNVLNEAGYDQNGRRGSHPGKSSSRMLRLAMRFRSWPSLVLRSAKSVTVRYAFHGGPYLRACVPIDQLDTDQPSSTKDAFLGLVIVVHSSRNQVVAAYKPAFRGGPG